MSWKRKSRYDQDSFQKDRQENQKEWEAIEEGFKGKRETDQQIQEKEIYRRRLLIWGAGIGSKYQKIEEYHS